MTKEKREWHYCLEPVRFDMNCDKCKGTNITWSEFVHQIWCYDCKIDTDGFDGIFGGPIPAHCAELMGISFDRVIIETGQIEKLNIENDENNLLQWIPMSDEDVVKKWKVVGDR